MKLTTTIKNFKNNIIGYFSTTKSNDSGSGGLRVIPFSYLNNKTSLDDFTWDKFVKVEFAIKDFDNLNIRLRCSDFTRSKTDLRCNIKVSPNETGELGINTTAYDDRIYLFIFGTDNDCEIVDNSTILKANDYLTDIIKTSLTNGSTSFNFISDYNANTATDILKILSCINVYYRV